MLFVSSNTVDASFTVNIFCLTSNVVLRDSYDSGKDDKKITASSS